jgi:transcriptional regulator with XRE-family HTH domain
MSPTDRLDVALKLLRIARGMSQKELEQASGVRNNAISKYESGKAVPKLETLLRLTAGLGLPLATVEEARAFIERLNQLADPGVESSAPTARPGARDLRREIDQVSAEAGRVATRLSALVLDLLSRLPEAAPAGEPARRRRE